MCVCHRAAITATAPADIPTSVQFDVVNQANSPSPDSFSGGGGVAGDATATAYLDFDIDGIIQ